MNILEKIIQNNVEPNTDKDEVLELFNTVFQENHGTINDALKAVKIKAINEESLFQTEINDIVEKIKSSYPKEDLERKLYIRLLESKEIDTRIIDFEHLKYIIETIGFNCLKNYYYLYEQEQYFRTDSDIKRLINKSYKIDGIDDNVISTYGSAKDTSNYLDGVTTFIINFIRDKNQFRDIKFESNPFSNEEKIEFSNQIMKITFNDIFPIIPKEYTDEKIVEDYKSHFQDLDIFLDFLLAVRFGADKKKSYIWFRAESDWGKSFFFQAILGELKLSTVITENELKKAYSGGASGFTIDMFTHSWFLFIDEFKSAVSEIKNITHQLSFSPKYQGQVTVPLFAKIFSSAENVSSLYNDGMVESQYANRFIFWEEKGKITDRKLYIENKMLYQAVLKTYVYNYLKTKSKEYIELGEMEASNVANKKLEEIIKLKMINTISVEEGLKDKISLFKDEFINFPELTGYFFEHNNSIYIKNSTKFKDVFLNHYFSEAERKIISHKENKVIFNLENEKRESIRVNGIPTSGYKWFSKKINNTSNYNLDSFERIAI